MEDRTLLATYLVTTTGDSGPGSLRQAILNSNGTSGPNTIDFDIGTGGPQTIVVDNYLPAIGVPTTIDGTTQPGYAGKPIIELHGYNPTKGGPSYQPGLEMSAAGSVARGLVINNFGEGIAIGADNALIAGNYIGTDMTGTVAIGNDVGIDIAANNATIGGLTASARNVISSSFPVGRHNT